MRADLQRLKRDTESGRSAAGAVHAGSLGNPKSRPNKLPLGRQSTPAQSPNAPKKWWIGLVPAAIAVVAIALLAFRFAVPLPPLKVSGYRPAYERW